MKIFSHFFRYNHWRITVVPARLVYQGGKMKKCRFIQLGSPFSANRMVFIERREALPTPVAAKAKDINTKEGRQEIYDAARIKIKQLEAKGDKLSLMRVKSLKAILKMAEEDEGKDRLGDPIESAKGLLGRLEGIIAKVEAKPLYKEEIVKMDKEAEEIAVSLGIFTPERRKLIEERAQAKINELPKDSKARKLLESNLKKLREEEEDIYEGRPEKVAKKLLVAEKMLSILEIDENYIIKCLKKLEERAGLMDFITEDTKFTKMEGGKISLTIIKDGKEIKYVVTDMDVLRVDKDRDPQFKEKVRKSNLKLTKLEKQLEEKVWTTLTLKEKNEFVEAGVGVWKEKLRGLAAKNKKCIPKLKELQKEEDKNKQLRTMELSDDDPTKPAEERLKIKDVLDADNSDWSEREYIDSENRKVSMVAYGKECKDIYTEFDRSTGKKSYRIYFRETGLKSYEINYDASGELLKRTSFSETGKPLGRRVRTKDRTEEGKYKYREEMFDDKGNPFSSFNYEQEKNPKLTYDEYLNLLAKNLNTPGKLHLFSETFMSYTEEKKDHWQLPYQTLDRVDEEDGTMLGDCDDYAFLMQAILRKQGKKPYVLLIPEHATCVWVEKRPDGRYDTYSVGTLGLDKNGNRYGMRADPEKDKGYKSVKEALNSLMVKFEEEDKDKGLEKGVKYRVQDNVTIMHIPKEGEKQYMVVPIDVFVNEAVAKEASQLSGRDFKANVEMYQKYIEKHPEAPAYHQGLAKVYGWEIDEMLAKNGRYIIDPAKVDSEYLSKNPALAALYDKEIAQLEAAVNKGSKNLSIRYRLGNLYVAKKETRKLITLLENTIKEGIKIKALAYEYLWWAYLKIGEKEKAKSTLALGLKTYPNSARLHALA